jgi:transposase-like protein
VHFLNGPLIELESYPGNNYTVIEGEAVMLRSNKVFNEVRYKIAREALSGIKVAVLARKYEVSPKSINDWVREYREKFGDENIPSPDEQIQEMKRLQEIEEKYEKAVKVLGAKELEIEILRELLKKSNPAYLKNSR